MVHIVVIIDACPQRLSFIVATLKLIQICTEVQSLQLPSCLFTTLCVQ